MTPDTRGVPIHRRGFCRQSGSAQQKARRMPGFPNGSDRCVSSSVLLPFDGGRFGRAGADGSRIELCLTVIGIETVLLLFDVGELRIAERADGRILQQRRDKPVIAFDEFRDGLRAVAVTPALCLL